MNYKLLFLIAGCCFLFFACQDETNIGEVLLENEVIDLNFESGFEMGALSARSDAPVGYSTYTDNFGLTTRLTTSTALLGTINDPVFGKVNSSFYSRIIYNPNASIPTFTNLTLDSAVLTLAYDTLGNYGNQTAVHNIVVQEIIEDFKEKDTIFTNTILTVNANTIASRSLVPAPKDSITILSHTDTTSLRLPAQIRLRLDQTWAEALIRNPLIETAPSSSTANDVLYSVFKGIKISSETSQNSILGIDVDDAAIASSGIDKLNFYFTDTAGKKSNYQFYFTRVKWNNFQLDPAGSPIEGFIEKPEKSDSLLFFQCMGGINSSIDLKDLTKLENKVINHAEIVLHVATLPGDDLDLYPPVSLMVMLYYKDGVLTEIEDLSLLRDLNLDITTSFGGFRELVNDKYQYRFNITRHLKYLQDNPDADSRIFIVPNNKIDRASRTVVYGPKSETLPVTLKVTYTEN